MRAVTGKVSGEIGSVLEVLAVLHADPQVHTVRQVCDRSGLSRSAVDRALALLRRRGMLLAGPRGFGVPTPLRLTEKGAIAGWHIREILPLIWRRTRTDTKEEPSASAPLSEGWKNPIVISSPDRKMHTGIE